MSNKTIELHPSSAAIHLACPSSLALSQGLETAPSDAAEKGTQAHKRFEVNIKKWFKREKVDEEFVEFTDYLNNHVKLDLYDSIHTEHKMKMKMWGLEVVGTTDCIISSNDSMHIIDYKSGCYPVSAKDNPQLILYAVLFYNEQKEKFNGAPLLYFHILQEGNCHYHIYTPMELERKCINYGSSIMWSGQIARYNEYYLAQANAVTGDHCKFCAGKLKCKKYQNDYNIEFLSELDVTEESLSLARKVVAKKKEIEQYIKDAEHMLLEIAKKEPKSLPEFKLVRGPSRRRVTKEGEEKIVEHERGNECYNLKLKGLKELESILGREFVNDCTEKPLGKITIVHESDSRQAVNFVEEEQRAAMALFESENLHY